MLNFPGMCTVYLNWATRELKGDMGEAGGIGGGKVMGGRGRE